MGVDMLAKIKNILLYAGLTKAEYLDIADELTTYNRSSLRIFAMIAEVFLGILFLISFVNEPLKANRTIYLIAFLITVVLFGIASYAKKNARLLIFLGMYLFMAVIFAFGIGLSIQHPEEATTTFITLLMVTPLLFNDKPYRVGIFILLFTGVFLIEVNMVKYDMILFTDIVNGIVFGLLSCVINTAMMIIKTERIIFSKKTQMYAETDVLTGLKNRNCYENKLQGYANLAKNAIVCIYVDVNGLHELNNTKGHAAGDKMLQFIAGIMQEEFGKPDTYRIGGDEFVAMAVDVSTEDAQKKIEKVQKATENEGYHISIGLANDTVASLDMDELVKHAEEKMYEAKKAYYLSRGYVRS